MISSSSSLKFRMSSDADTDSKYFLLQDGLLPALEVLNYGKDSRILLGSGQTSPGIKVLNVSTQAYKCRISDANCTDFLSIASLNYTEFWRYQFLFSTRGLYWHFMFLPNMHAQIATTTWEGSTNSTGNNSTLGFKSPLLAFDAISTNWRNN